jgi:hypothetical protein
MIGTTLTIAKGSRAEFRRVGIRYGQAPEGSSIGVVIRNSVILIAQRDEHIAGADLDCNGTRAMSACAARARKLVRSNAKQWRARR